MSFVDRLRGVFGPHGVTRQGVTFAGRRDFRKALGYAERVDPQELRARYERGGFAHALVDRVVGGCWRGQQIVLVDGEENEELTAFAEEADLWDVGERADRFAAMTGWSGIVFQDDVLGVWGADRLSMEWHGEELIGYHLVGRLVRIPPASVVHVAAQDRLDSQWVGVPLLLPVWDRLDDLDKLLGAQAEAFWRRSDPGLHFDVPAAAAASTGIMAELQRQVEEYEHGFRRTVRTAGGTTVTPLAVSTASAAADAKLLLQVIASVVGLPLRVLLGTEAGSLASSQDKQQAEAMFGERWQEFSRLRVALPLLRAAADAWGVELPEGVDVQRRDADDVLDFQQRLDRAELMIAAGLTREGLESLGVEVPDDFEEPEPYVPAFGGDDSAEDQE